MKTKRVKRNGFPRCEDPREREGVLAEVCLWAVVRDERGMKNGGVHWDHRLWKASLRPFHPRSLVGGTRRSAEWPGTSVWLCRESWGQVARGEDS